VYWLHYCILFWHKTETVPGQPGRTRSLNTHQECLTTGSSGFGVLPCNHWQAQCNCHWFKRLRSTTQQIHKDLEVRFIVSTYEHWLQVWTQDSWCSNPVIPATWMAKGCPNLPSVLTKQDDRNSAGKWTLSSKGSQVSNTAVTVTEQIQDCRQLQWKSWVNLKDGWQHAFSEPLTNSNYNPPPQFLNLDPYYGYARSQGKYFWLCSNGSVHRNGQEEVTGAQASTGILRNGIHPQPNHVVYVSERASNRTSSARMQ
jgi:hypothetical protein